MRKNSGRDFKNAWEKEYEEKKLVNLGTEPQEDTKRFVKWLRKDRGVILENLKVLDAGCGNGRNSFYLHEQGSVTTGYDIASNVISEAKNRDRSLNFFVHDMSDELKFADDSFDLVLDVTSSNSLNSKDRQKYLKETFRVLKSGGYMFLKTLCLEGDENAKYLIKNSPAKEVGMYKLPGTEITEKPFTEKEIREIYIEYADFLKIEKKFSYTRMNNRSYKRAFWIIYLQKK